MFFLNRGIRCSLHASRLISESIFFPFFSTYTFYFVFFSQNRGVQVSFRAQQFLFSLLFKNVLFPYTFFNCNFHCAMLFGNVFSFFLTGLFICFFLNRGICGSLYALQLISESTFFKTVFFPFFST